METNKQGELKRVLSLPLVSLFGLGNILGAGIYVLIGRVAAESGYYAPLSFIVAACIAAITAFSFAELSSRFPLSAGSALYVHRGFNRQQLTRVIGILVVLTGIVSAATMAKGFVGYLSLFFETSDWLVILLLLFFLGALASWGISQSVATAAVITAIEVLGLLIVLAVAMPDAAQFSPSQLMESEGQFFNIFGIMSGSFLAFYAFIGFEDMVNVAEEVKQPRRNMPLAIVFSLVGATVLYVLVAVAALLVVPPQVLGQSDAPLALVYETATGNNAWLISLISLFAVINGALIQIIMGSRVLYGLAREDLLPKLFALVNPMTSTPIFATWVVSGLVVIAAWWFPIEVLARTTTTLLLVVFCCVNISLIKIKQRGEQEEGIFEVPIFEVPIFEVPIFEVPMAVPIAGALVCGLFLIGEGLSFLTT